MASKQLHRGTPPLPKVHQVVANHCLSDVYLKELQADQQTILQSTSSNVQFRIIPALLEREIAGCKTTALETSVSSLRSSPSSNGNSSASSEETAALIEALFADQATIISLEHNSPQVRFNHVPVLLQREIATCETKKLGLLTKPSEGIVTLTEQIPIPCSPKLNIIGRLLGPRGITIKSLERELDCLINIRGHGEGPKRKHGNTAHVLVTSKDSDWDRTYRKLEAAGQRIRQLMSPLGDNDPLLCKQRKIICMEPEAESPVEIPSSQCFQTVPYGVCGPAYPPQLVYSGYSNQFTNVPGHYIPVWYYVPTYNASAIHVQQTAQFPICR